MIKYLVVILILLSGCSWNRISGKYESYWYETYYELILNKDQTFHYSYKGHRGISKYKGTYEINKDTITLREQTSKIEEVKFLIYNDSCIVELESRFNYCIRTTDEWDSERISINYPQLLEKNKIEKEEVISWK